MWHFLSPAHIIPADSGSQNFLRPGHCAVYRTGSFYFGQTVKPLPLWWVAGRGFAERATVLIYRIAIGDGKVLSLNDRLLSGAVSLAMPITFQLIFEFVMLNSAHLIIGQITFLYELPKII